MNHDLRSPVWLEKSVRYTRPYQRQENLAKELVDADAVSCFFTDIFVSMSNRQLRETADHAERWLKDLALCEAESNEELSEELKKTKASCQIIADLCSYHRSARQITLKNGTQSYRRQ
jgi:DNA-directed RNA polymerase subunit F